MVTVSLFIDMLMYNGRMRRTPVAGSAPHAISLK